MACFGSRTRTGDGRIEKVFYPVFPPDAHASEVLAWLVRTPGS